jgi:RNA polymerase sigma-70 factor (ECF subfamily)
MHDTRDDAAAMDPAVFAVMPDAMEPDAASIDDVPATESTSEALTEEAPAQAPPRPDELDRARDRALVEEALKGNLDAFNRLVELYQDMLFGLTVRVVNDRDAAADAVQEAFLSAYRNLSRFRGDSFRSWLTRIALNAATDILRLRKRRPADPFPEWEDESWQPPTDEAEGPEATAVRRSRSLVIAQAMAQITTDQRAAIVLYDVEGYDYQEIADMQGVSLGTVKSRIHRGRLALRDLLADQMELLRN